MTPPRAVRRLPHVGGGRVSHRLLAVLALVLVTGGTTWFSGATFTSESTTAVDVRAAADFFPPTVTVNSPGTTVTGTVDVTATATDSASAITEVKVEYAAAGSATWVAICTDTVAPYACAWDTTKVVDGDYQLRASATDAAGYSATSATVSTQVANAAAVDLATVPDAIRGTYKLTATVTGAAGRSVSSLFQYRVSGTTSWTNMTGCTAVAGTSPTCDWATGSLTDVYDVQIVSTLGTETTTVVKDGQSGISVDNIAPTVTVAAPSPMSGTVLVTASPLDDESGVARVELSYRLAGTTTWTALCTVTADPYRCSLDTTKLTNLANYELRAIATDNAGNATTSAVITRQVSNGIASVTITSPVSGEVLRGTRTLTVDTTTPTGTAVTGVRYERRVPGGSWGTAACSASATPWSCAWDTTTVTSGSYELRAIMTYTGDVTATSAVVTITVDNNPLYAVDIQARNGGTLGLAGAGDTLTFTYSTMVDLTTIKSGWGGGSTPVAVTMADKSFGTGSATDRATFDVPLGQVTFAQNYVRNNKSVTIGSTMTASTTTVGGIQVTVITVTLGGSTSNDLRIATATGTMRWTPASGVRSTSGAVISTTTAVESGAADSDL